MKPFNLQRQFMGFLLLGAQRPTPHNLPQPWLSPWSCAAPGAGSSAGAQMRWRWAPLPCQHCRPPRVFLLPMGLAPVQEGSQGTCPSLPCCVMGEAAWPLCPQTTWKPHGPELVFQGNPHLLPESKVFFLVACWYSEGKGASARAWALSSGAVVICWEQPGPCRPPCCGAGNLSDLHRCLHVSPATAQSSVTCSLLFYFFLITWG